MFFWAKMPCGLVARSINPKEHYQKQTKLIEAITINYNLFPKSSLDTRFNKLITNLRLPMLMNLDCMTVEETPESPSAHRVGKQRAANTTSLTGVEYQHDQPNGAKFKIIPGIHLLQTQACYFTPLCHFRLVCCTTSVNTESHSYSICISFLKHVKYKFHMSSHDSQATVIKLKQQEQMEGRHFDIVDGYKLYYQTGVVSNGSIVTPFHENQLHIFCRHPNKTYQRSL
jgi:hypothetical protein